MNIKTSKNIEDLITVITILSILFMLFFISFIKSDVQFSPNENRKMTLFPNVSVESISSGNFMEEFEQYSQDQIIARDKFMEIKSQIELLMGKKDNGKVYFGKEGYLFQIDKIDYKQLQKNIDYVSQFMNNVNTINRQINTSILIAPTQTEIMGEYLPKYAIVPKEEEIIERINEKISNHTNIVEVLRQKSKEYLYYRTDHHWTTLGAYYAYEKWANDNGFEILPPQDFIFQTVSKGFYGTSYSRGGIKVEPDYIQKWTRREEPNFSMKIVSNREEKVMDSIYDEKYMKLKDQYGYFLSGNNPLIIIEKKNNIENRNNNVTDNDNSGMHDRNLLLIKDSYAHCFVPFLTQHFDKIVAVDMRYYRESPLNLIDEHEITDVMFLYNVIGFSNDKNLVYLKSK